jgi:hypothetical protein
MMKVGTLGISGQVHPQAMQGRVTALISVSNQKDSFTGQGPIKTPRQQSKYSRPIVQATHSPLPSYARKEVFLPLEVQSIRFSEP